ncbi:glycoside hydrolase family 4 [Actinomadura sp. 6N118]|uniref:family 4 glycosyl hydrolase n=1 Tax=Actinomadura sp. 6N118 TaxID=3375151 RepID=UPI00378B2732
MKIAIIGAGSGYMPGVIRGLLHRADDLAGAELAFHDIDAGNLALMARLATNMFTARSATTEPATFTITTHTDLKPALDGAAYILTTFRPGGMAARHLDESIPLKHGVVGQETAGPGGFMMACRSIPVLLEIAAHAEPSAWIVNYTNPTNIVTDAVTRNTGIRIIGLCDQFVGDTEMWAQLLGLPYERLEVDWIGLNHATWAERVRLDGKEIDLPALLGDLEIPGGGATPWRDPSRMAELAKALGFLPNSYSKYYFFHDQVVEELRAKGTTRSEDIQAMLPRFFAQIAEESTKPDPDPSRERGGGKHGEFAIDVICTLHRNESRRVIVNTTNNGAISSLPPEAIVEVPSLLTAAGPVPLAQGPLPRAVRGLTQSIHEYERLASDAAVTGSRQLALQALMAHPFVTSKKTAEKILDEGLAAHRAHLPQFS